MIGLCLTGCVPGPGFLPHNFHQSVLFISVDELLVDVAGNLYCVVRGLLQNILDTVLRDVDTGGDLQQIHSGPRPHLLPPLGCYIY